MKSVQQAQVVSNPSVCPVGSGMASLVGMSDTIIRPVVVKPEGTSREYTVSDFICITSPQTAGKYFINANRL